MRFPVGAGLWVSVKGLDEQYHGLGVLALPLPWPKLWRQLDPSGALGVKERLHVSFDGVGGGGGMPRHLTVGDAVVNACAAGGIGSEILEDRRGALLVLDDIAAEEDAPF